MVDGKNIQVMKQPDIEEFYKVLSGYVEYCIQKKQVKLTDKEKKGLSPADIAQKEEEIKEEIQRIKEQKRIFQEKFDSVCCDVADGGLMYLSAYIDVAEKLYKENRDWKEYIVKMLVDKKSLKLFRDSRSDLVGMYPLLTKVNELFSIDDYPELSIAPRAALYGSEVNKTQKGSRKFFQLGNKDIQAMLDAFLKVKDYKRFGEWIMAILCFEPTQLIDGFSKEFLPLREELKNWVLSQVDRNENYKFAFMDTFMKGNNLTSLLNAFVEQPVLKRKQVELEEKIKILEKANQDEKDRFENVRKKQFNIIQEHKANIADLQQIVQQKFKDFEHCKQERDMYSDKYYIQIAMNERIVAENKRRLSEMQTDCDKITEEYSRLETEYLALQSDFRLKNNEFMRMKDVTEKKEETARIDTMRQLISGINEQFFYLTMFYLDLKDTGKLEPESIELFAATLENIDNVLMELGIEKIGVINKKVVYDASIHSSADVKISNGEQVVFRGYGWKIGDEIYIKAPVEKGE